ncbi:hypothetical protein EJC47_10810 [Sphingomonas sp. TF3]|uniref:hypothetical protein n=1 Tax=Sphingomonas sp. TF3 TaxID=2495580 RepID=UPI000F874293|nr:hypothetical protein [Sphingomonas sp. TF3]RUN76459.1 hypothetical protein EJC47_10810 [Sphingomonas sp. TF3]
MTTPATPASRGYWPALSIWWNFVFNYWALTLATLFLVVGFITGYAISQPSRYSAPAGTMLKRLDALEALLENVQSHRLPRVQDDRHKLTMAIDSVRAALVGLPDIQKKRIAPYFVEIETHGRAIDQTLDSQSFLIDSALSEHLKSIRAQREQIKQQIDTASGFGSLVFDQSKLFLKWIGALSFLTIVAISLFLVLMSSPSFRRRLAGSSGTITAFGVSFNLHDLSSERDSIEARQHELGDDLVRTYTKALRASSLQARFREVYKDIEAAFAQETIALDAIPHRATLYIPDFVGESLVQATLYSGNWHLGDERSVGRRFSVRYGIIGKAWRLVGAQYNSNVGNSCKNLIRNWGFTDTEAKPFGNDTASGSLMAFIVKDSGPLAPLAVIYVEALGANTLHKKDVLSDAEAADQAPDIDGLTKADHYAARHIWAQVKDKRSVERLKQALLRLQAVLRWNDKIEGGTGR